MDTDQYKRSLLNQLRTEKARLELSCQMIADRTEANGEAISVSTVSKVFAPSAIGSSYKLSTLLAIAHALGLTPLEDNADLELAVRLEEVQKSVQSKDEQITSMRAVVQANTAQMDRLLVSIQEKERRILILTVLLCTTLALAAILLGFDILQPGVGYIVRK